MLKKYADIMMVNKMEDYTSFNKLKNLLKKIFRVDYADLDFGIYKIMKYKSKAIDNFIANIKKEVDDFNPIDDDKELFYNDVYNRIYDFFSRYFDNGDLIPQLRFGGRTKYYIPYNGNEVSLYWVNDSEYYIKTTEYFYKYVFKAYNQLDKNDHWTIYFKIKDAELEKNYVKNHDEKYFLLDYDPILIDEKNNELTIFFNYRKLSDEDLTEYNISLNDRNIKDTLRPYIINKILNKINHNESLYNILTAKETDKTLLEKHLNIYIKKNNGDYFIHKNLKGFLFNEVEFYLKGEVLDIDNIEQSYEKIKKIKNISTKIIEFLSQIEDFEKKLWEKKKYIYNVNYVITLDKIENRNGMNLIKKIINSPGIEKQISEWKDLELIDDTFIKENIIKSNLTEEVNSHYKFLPIDTKYFNELKYEILSLFDNLDEQLDGILVHSENYQGLNTILPKFKDKIQTIYIDPPFNKEENADYLYNVKYKDATWITLLENRISLARAYLDDQGSIFVRCDYNGNMYVKLLMNTIFGRENFRNEMVVKRGSPKAGLFLQFEKLKSIGVMYDNLYWFSNYPHAGYSGFIKKLLNKTDGYWASFKKIYDRPTMRYEILGINLDKGQWMWSKEKAFKAMENYTTYLQESKTTGETLELYSDRTGIKEFVRRHNDTIQYWVSQKDSVLLDNNWLDIPGYSSGWNFRTENSEILLKRVIESTSDEGDLILDFFLGSGTTAAVAHKLKRKWIGIEMGDHFSSVDLRRMKTVLYYDKSGISKEKDVKEKYNENNAGGFFKYFDLEQYEDSLNNIEDDQELSNSKVLQSIPNYEIKYMLDYETNNSKIFLNANMLEDPFNYKLKIINGGEEKSVNMDLVETFNYLYNVNVNKILSFNDKNYIFVYGTKDDESLLIVWRQLNNIDYTVDRDFIYKVKDEYFHDIIIDTVFTNGNNIIDDSRIKNGGKSLDPLINKLIFGGK